MLSHYKDWAAWKQCCPDKEFFEFFRAVPEARAASPLPPTEQIPPNMAVPASPVFRPCAFSSKINTISLAELEAFPVQPSLAEMPSGILNRLPEFVPTRGDPCDAQVLPETIVGRRTGRAGYARCRHRDRSGVRREQLRHSDDRAARRLGRAEFPGHYRSGEPVLRGEPQPQFLRRGIRQQPARIL